MRVQVMFCDCCEMPIPKVIEKDIFGNDKEFYKFGKLNFGCSAFSNVDCRTLGIDLCPSCADKISLIAQQKKIEMLTNYYWKNEGLKV